MIVKLWKHSALGFNVISLFFIVIFYFQITVKDFKGKIANSIVSYVVIVVFERNEVTLYLKSRQCVMFLRNYSLEIVCRKNILCKFPSCRKLQLTLKG